MPVRDGAIVALDDQRIAAASELHGAALPPVLVVSGTCMDSGKTRFLAELVQQLSERGLKIAGGKLTGIACLRDIYAMEDHGAAAVASFLDAGYPSTAGLDESELLDAALSVISHLAADTPDLMVLELGDGVIGDYGSATLLSSAAFRELVRLHVFCAGDLVGAWGGVRYLKDLGVAVDLISGPCTDTIVGTEYIGSEFDLPAMNAPRDPEAIAELVLRTVGLESKG